MVCYGAAGWANLGMWKSESVPPRPSPRLPTGPAALLGQPSVSQESFLPGERLQSAFMESKLEEVASPAQGNTLCSVRTSGEVGEAGLILLKVSLCCTASTWQSGQDRGQNWCFS